MSNAGSSLREQLDLTLIKQQIKTLIELVGTFAELEAAAQESFRLSLEEATQTVSNSSNSAQLLYIVSSLDEVEKVKESDKPSDRYEALQRLQGAAELIEGLKKKQVSKGRTSQLKTFIGNNLLTQNQRDTLHGLITQLDELVAYFDGQLTPSVDQGRAAGDGGVVTGSSGDHGSPHSSPGDDTGDPLARVTAEVADAHSALASAVDRVINNEVNPDELARLGKTTDELAAWRSQFRHDGGARDSSQDDVDAALRGATNASNAARRAAAAADGVFARHLLNGTPPATSSDTVLPYGQTRAYEKLNDHIRGLFRETIKDENGSDIPAPVALNKAQALDTLLNRTLATATSINEAIDAIDAVIEEHGGNQPDTVGAWITSVGFSWRSDTTVLLEALKTELKDLTPAVRAEAGSPSSRR